MARKKAPKPELGESIEQTSVELASQDGDDGEIENWAKQPESKAYEKALKLYSKIQRCYDNKEQQGDDIEAFWNIYNAITDENQMYTGNSSIYIPEVRNCINARVKRTLKQLFPANHKHVDALSADDHQPYPVLALLEHYIRSTKLKQVVKADLIAGDVTGQWNIYVDWRKAYRKIREVIREPKILKVAGEIEVEDPTEYTERVKKSTVITEGPDIVAFATEDLAVYPPTVDDIEDAEASAIRLRLSKSRVQEFMDAGIFYYEGGDADALIENLAKPDKGKEKRSPPKERTNDAGIKTEGTYQYALIYEVHCNLPLDDDDSEQPAYVYFASPTVILGIIRNPAWSGKRPIISAPIEKMTGSFFGKSKVDPVKYMQWNLIDFANMGQDSAQYGLLPVIMTDPLQNPNWQAMVMGMAAIWPVDPGKTRALEFPQLWKDSAAMCQFLQGLIRESMDVNDSMMGKGPPGRKNAQAIAAQSQDAQVSITDHAEMYEEYILNPLIERIFELDQQFRTKELTILSKGEVGVRAKMLHIEPQQFGQRFFFWWSGTAYISGMQRIQQQIAWMNVLRGMPPQLLNGKKLDITPILEAGTEAIFGPEIAPHILIDQRDLMTIDPEQENVLLANGFDVDVHPEDPDPEHLKKHTELAMKMPDMAGNIRLHIQKHMAQMAAKRQQQIAQQQAQLGGPKGPGAPGAPGGAGPGVAGTPRPGAQPAQPRPQQPPGAIHPDQMADPMAGAR